MLPLQWVAWGLLLVVVDITLGGWDLLADPVGWAVVVVGTRRLQHLVGAPVVVAAAVALVVSLATWPPGLLQVTDPALSWGLSLPEEVFSALLALRLRSVLAARYRTFTVLAWCFVVVAITPPVVLVVESAALVLLLAGFAVIVTIWLIVVLLRAATELPPA